MIEDYRSLAVFVAIADTGSLSAAGRRLKLSTSVVSHHLSRLEERQGVTLFFRSTRSMSLTPEGHAALEPARRMVAAGEEALDALGADSDEPVGALRITMPAFGERSPLRKALWAFTRQHPMVSISLLSSDAPADLIKDGLDLAIRLGTLADSSLKNRRIGEFRRQMVASPAYLATRPAPRTPEDLAGCDFLSVARLRPVITLHRDGQSVSFEPERVRIEVNSVSAAKSAIMSGLGIWHLPRSEIEEELAEGTLVAILPEWELPVLGVYAVWPDSGPQKALTRRLIDFFLNEIASDAL